MRSEISEEEVEATIRSALTDPLVGAIDDFRTAVDEAESVLYLADNAGEIVFDRLLLEEMPKDKVVVAVKGAPIINDATMDDAVAAGVPYVVEVIDNGSDAPGTILESCSPAFRSRFESADLVISKGQGNYETVSGLDKPIFFLLKAKCQVIADDLGVPVGSLVLRHNCA